MSITPLGSNRSRWGMTKVGQLSHLGAPSASITTDKEVQHLIVSESAPFRCQCGQDFTRLCSLERHIRHHAGQLNLDALHPCTECPDRQGKNGFKRLEHLKQHLQGFHKWDNDQLATLFPPRKAHILRIPVCHFPECDYYRGPGFEDMGVREREENRPFDKQSHYTDHMKREHDWSPYPCKVTGCNKVNGSGFFSTTTFERHYKKKHAGYAIPAPKVQDHITETVTCDYCRKSFSRNGITSHQEWRCEGIAPCRYCGQRMMSRQMMYHQGYECTGEVVCLRCHERIESRQMGKHPIQNCKAEVICPFCRGHMESRQLQEHERNYCEGEAKCSNCAKPAKRCQLRAGWWVRSPSCVDCAPYLFK
ncbi:hypothetical protein F4803DRAFT_165300 [Xylaria telfairii]|nr:hypothetical protein F4803DRAFT_165300 [Xylaria telfairii]